MDKAKNLTDLGAITKLRETVEAIRVCMFFTGDNLQEEKARPMSAAEIDEEGCIWFLAGKASGKIAAIEKSAAVHLVFCDPGKQLFLDLHGEASLATDKDKIEKCWTPDAKAWFPEGINDPNIILIKVRASNGNYWDVRRGKMIELLQMISSAVTGKKKPDAVSGKIALVH